MAIALTFQILGVICSATAPLLFAAPRLPRIKKLVRPHEFETGWYTFVVKGRLNHDEEGFIEVLRFLIGHQSKDGIFAETVANDLGIDSSDIISETTVPAVEEIRIITRPPDWRENILLCYDEATEGPPGEPEVTPNHGFKKPNTDVAGEDWRWFGPLSSIEYNVQRYTSEKIDRWTSYGAIALAIGVFFQLLAIVF